MHIYIKRKKNILVRPARSRWRSTPPATRPQKHLLPHALSMYLSLYGFRCGVIPMLLAGGSAGLRRARAVAAASRVVG